MNGGRTLIIIAGPNGAGKTSFAQEYLPKETGCIFFVNADLIASGLAPFAPETAALRAGRLMLEEIRYHVRLRHNFAFETTLSGLTYRHLIPAWQHEGYVVKLIYLSLATPDLAVERVAARVRQGGHKVPENVIRRRFVAGWRHFQEDYKLLVNMWLHYDNSGPSPVLVDAHSNL